MNIVKKIEGENKKAWDSKIKYVVWEDTITTKTSIGKTMFELVHGLEAKLSINLQIPTVQFAQQYMTNNEALQGRIDQLIELDESRRNALDQMARNQEKIKGIFDHKARQRSFKEGDHVLVWDKRKEKLGMHKKFDNLWIGPYQIESEADTNFHLSHT
jgi:hypothetical protein